VPKERVAKPAFPGEKCLNRRVLQVRKANMEVYMQRGAERGQRQQDKERGKVFQMVQRAKALNLDA
jgi:hypothetical protein